MQKAAIVSLIFLWIVLEVLIFSFLGAKHRSKVTEIDFYRSSFDKTAAKAITTVQFPYEIANTELVIEGLYPYDGPFWEDGSGVEVTGVAALVVENVSNSGIDKARITVCQGKKLLRFSASMIPPGAKIVILEENKAGFSQEEISYCFGSRTLQLQGWNISCLEYKNDGIDKLHIENTSDKPLKNIRLFYKDYLQGMYIGGASNEYQIGQLQPGEGITISPGRYAGDSSRILCVLTN